MDALVVVLVILGCVAYQYLIITICASIVAFGYFETLANVFISRGGSTRYPALVPWAQPLCFVLLFVLAFAVLQTIAGQLTRRPVDLGPPGERIGRIVCGIFLGLIMSGLLLTVLAMAPISTNYPYQRFDASRPDAEKPNKALFNADGFATRWFSIVSSGSFSGKRSFATLHPDFLDQVFLNRHKIADGISITTGSEAIKVPEKKAAWPAPEALKDSNGRAVSLKSGHTLTIVRVGINKRAIKDDGTFTLSQLRVICKQKEAAKNPLVGWGKNIYPAGYLKTAEQLQIKKLDDQIKLQQADFDGAVRWIDFAFYVPNGFMPVLVEFKQNNIARVPPSVSYEQAPPAISFIQLSECAKDTAKLQRISSAKVYGLELAARNKFLSGLKLEISDANQWQSVQTARSIKPAQFDQEGKVNYVRAELKIEKPAKEQSKASKRAGKGGGISTMLKPLDGYRLLSLKCNNPSTGRAIKTERLPVLVELSGLVHHPVGIIASGKIADQIVYEIDYCSLTDAAVRGGLKIAEDGSVEQPFPDIVWLTEQAQSISEFYVLYLVKSGRSAIITSVQPADSQMTAPFKGYEGFFIK
jgi:hypothetical protein